MPISIHIKEKPIGDVQIGDDPSQDVQKPNAENEHVQTRDGLLLPGG